jgi:outer membrane protein TolC
VWQQEQLIASLNAQMTTLQGDIDAHKRAINLLLGRSVLEDLPLSKEAKLIALSAQPGVGIPATKLLNRPDVKQAYYSLASANASLAEAIKNQYPSLNLSLSVGSLKTVTHFSDLLDTIIGTAMASISGTLFDGGAKEALVKQAHFLSKERSLNYKQVMLQAFGEVQEAQNREINLTLYLRELSGRITLAQNIFDRQREKYLLGVVEYLSVLSAEQSLYDLEQTRLSKRVELIKYRIALHRSLAGGFLDRSILEDWSSYEK